MLGLMQDWPLRLHRLLDYAAAQHGGREIVSRDPGGAVSRTTYAALKTRALAVAARLVQDGIGPGDRVATLAWNSARHMEVWYGTAGMGAVYHTVNPRLFAPQIVWIVNHARDRMIFVDACFLPLLETMVADLPSVERVVVMGGAGPLPAGRLPGAVHYEDWLAEAAGPVGWAEVDERSACGLCYTSGTTAEPKGVLYSHRSTLLHAMAESGSNVFAIGMRDTVMPVVPMFHVNAWGLAFAAPLVGARLVMPGAQLDGASLYGLMEAEGVTHAAGVPTIWMGLLDHVRRNGLRFSTLRRMLVGGSACPRAVIESFERDFGVEVCHAWGMTETSPVGSTGTLKPEVAGLEGAARLDVKQKQGCAMFGVDLRIVDDDGRSLPHDGETFGRLTVSGFAVASAYFGDDKPILDRDGFFDTGDVAIIDPHGYMSIVDRSKDVIKSGGEWISSIAIENLAMAHPDVAEAAVIGLPHPKWSERPLLVVVPRGEARPTFDQMRAFLDGKIARWWMPDALRIVESLPHTATGKISKKDLRAQFRDFAFPAC